MPGAGRPTLYRPEYCRLVETLGEEGNGVAQIAASSGSTKERSHGGVMSMQISRPSPLSCILLCGDNILPQPISDTFRFRYDDSTQIRSMRIFHLEFLDQTSPGFRGTGFLGDATFGPLRRPRRVLGALTTFRAAGRELGRRDVERRTPSATVGRDHRAHCRPDAGDAFYAGAGAGAGQKTPLISLQSSIPQDTNSVSMALMPDRWNPASTSVSVSVTAHHAGYEPPVPWFEEACRFCLEEDRRDAPPPTTN
jgi:hypothetical protein